MGAATLHAAPQLAILCHLTVCCAVGVCQVIPVVDWEASAPNTKVSNRLAISPDGHLAATLGTNNTIQLWRMSDGLPVRALSEHTSWVSELAFSPDGRFLASGDGDRAVHVWRTDDWTEIYSVATPNQGPALAFSPDSTTLAIGSGTTVELRHATNGAVFRSWTATTSGWHLTAMAFSPDGTRLATGAGSRGADISLKMWGVPTGALEWSVATAQTYSVARIVFSPEGGRVLTGSDSLHTGPMQEWRVSDGSLVRTYPDPAFAMAFSSDGAILAAAGRDVSFFRTADGMFLEKYLDGSASSSSGPKGIALTADGQRFVLSRGFGRVLVAYTPLLLSVSPQEPGRLAIEWAGGTGRYQLQQWRNPAEGWQDEGGTLLTNTVVVHTDVSSALFRVLALPP